MKQKITEKDNLQEKWYKEVKEIKTPEEAKEFITRLINDYVHDYGTIVHACTAAALAGFHAMDNSPSGGITGFQAGCIGWEMIHKFMMIKAPAKILDYNNMLYPQYQYKFEKTITKETWELLQKEAKKNLGEQKLHVAGAVVDHWQSIASGKIPFGYTISED